MARQMTLQKLVLSMFNATSYPVTEEEYKLLYLSKLQILKRKKFPNIYRALMLYLIRLSIPAAFPEKSRTIMDKFDEMFAFAYRDEPALKSKIEQRLKKFGELTDFDEENPFQKVALYIVEQFESKPRKLLYSALLAKRINDTFLSFVSGGSEIEIIEDPYEPDIVELIERQKE